MESYLVYGLRVMSPNPETYEPGETPIVGKMLEQNSYHWMERDGSDGEELDGVCAIRVEDDNMDEALKMIQQYRQEGCPLVLLGSDYAQEGADTGEIVMHEAVVLKIFEE